LVHWGVAGLLGGQLVRGGTGGEVGDGDVFPGMLDTTATFVSAPQHTIGACFGTGQGGQRPTIHGLVGLVVARGKDPGNALLVRLARRATRPRVWGLESIGVGWRVGGIVGVGVLGERRARFGGFGRPIALVIEVDYVHSATLDVGFGGGLIEQREGGTGRNGSIGNCKSGAIFKPGWTCWFYSE